MSSHRPKKEHKRGANGGGVRVGRGSVPSLETAHYRASAIVVDAFDWCTRLLEREGRQSTVRDSYHDMVAVNLLRSAFEPSSPALVSVTYSTITVQYISDILYTVLYCTVLVLARTVRLQYLPQDKIQYLYEYDR